MGKAAPLDGYLSAAPQKTGIGTRFNHESGVSLPLTRRNAQPPGIGGHRPACIGPDLKGVGTPCHRKGDLRLFHRQKTFEIGHRLNSRNDHMGMAVSVLLGTVGRVDQVEAVIAIRATAPAPVDMEKPLTVIAIHHKGMASGHISGHRGIQRIEGAVNDRPAGVDLIHDQVSPCLLRIDRAVGLRGLPVFEIFLQGSGHLPGIGGTAVRAENHFHGYGAMISEFGNLGIGDARPGSVGHLLVAVFGFPEVGTQVSVGGGIAEASCAYPGILPVIDDLGHGCGHAPRRANSSGSLIIGA